MKFLLLVFFILFSLFAGNMSLGKYNNENFKTKKEQADEQKKRQIQKEKQEKLQLEKFEKRQAVLKEKRIFEREQRVEKRRLAQEKIRQEKLETIRIAKEKEYFFRLEKEKELKAKEELAKQHMLEDEKLLALEESNDYNSSLTPEQADLTVLNPDDIETELANATRLRYLLLNSANTPEYIKDYIRFLLELEEKYNISMAFSYRAIAQAELDSGTFGGGGKYDFTLMWKPAAYMQFATKIEGRHQVGRYSSTEFRDEFDALTSTSAGYSKRDAYVSQLWMQNNIKDFTVRLGKIDSSSYIDSHLFKSSSRFFFSGNFSISPYNSYPQNGIGIAGKYVKPGYYVSAEVTDANAIRDEINNSFFTDKDYYKAVEFGITPEDGSKYHITAWHRDESDMAVEAEGMIASFVQALDTNTHLIIRGAFSDYARAKRYASIGIGKFSLFQEHDISGLAIGLLKPRPIDDEEIPERSQYTLEYFYRIDPMPGVQLSADMQIIYHPTKGNQTFAYLPGLRLRILF